jgi:nucleoside 2-deoxyribosyltransferase
MPLLRARSEKEIGFLLAQMRSRSLLETDNDRVHLTLQGWQEVEALRGVTERSRRVFVAMSFRPELDGAYDVGIRPAIEGVGLEAIRVDREQFNDKICDRIVAEIRACGALVAEVTGHRPGVYFEAGLAMGLGKPVVWACRRDELAAAHFDTRQYNHLVWETPEELHSRLSDRLRATIVPELRLHDP